MNPLVLMHFVSGAHNDALMLGLVVAGLTLALEGRPIVGVIIITLGGTVKAPALLTLGFVGLAWAASRDGRPDPRRHTRAWTWAAVGGIALATFLAVNLATGLNFGWVSALGTPGMVRTMLSPATALGVFLGWLGATVGLGHHASAVLSVVRTGAEIAILATIAWWLLRRRAVAPGAGAGAALLMLAVFGPVLQAWYVLWGVVVLAGTALGRRGIPYLTAGITTLVVYCLLQPVATTSPIVRLPDWFVSGAALAVGLSMLLSHTEVRADLRARLRLRRRTASSAAVATADAELAALS
jgi:alpha-1,6-mannosyltransferase